jgi:hypothetical protein
MAAANSFGYNAAPDPWGYNNMDIHPYDAHLCRDLSIGLKALATGYCGMVMVPLSRAPDNSFYYAYMERSTGTHAQLVNTINTVQLRMQVGTPNGKVWRRTRQIIVPDGEREKYPLLEFTSSDPEGRHVADYFYKVFRRESESIFDDSWLIISGNATETFGFRGPAAAINHYQPETNKRIVFALRKMCSADFRGASIAVPVVERQNAYAVLIRNGNDVKATHLTLVTDPDQSNRTGFNQAAFVFHQGFAINPFSFSTDQFTEAEVTTVLQDPVHKFHVAQMGDISDKIQGCLTAVAMASHPRLNQNASIAQIGEDMITRVLGLLIDAPF